MATFAQLELQRQILQAKLDKLKTQKERNVMGQFSTPIVLANHLFEYAKKVMPKREKIRFLDPAIGTGSFFSALNSVFSSARIETALGYEIDSHYGKLASELWSDTFLDYQLVDFTKAIPPKADEDKYNLIVCNPPYVRHHHIIGQKGRLQAEALSSANMKLSGLAGLYCYFMALSHRWMKSNGFSGWLIPGEFMDVNYGQAIKNYLLNEVKLLQIHRFDPNDIQFDDALVSSAVVWFRNKKPGKNHKVKFTYGGTINKPYHEKEVCTSTLITEKKWSRFPLSEIRIENGVLKLGDFFTIKRGIATGDNKFFVISREEIKKRELPLECFHPILPSPRYLPETVIDADKDGNPILATKLFVLDCKLSIEEVKLHYPKLYDYLQEGTKCGVSDRYLCRNRKIWYAQENRPESSFYCTYIGRSNKKGRKPFRFILNYSKAIVTNSYLVLYPKPKLMKKIKSNSKMNKKIIEVLNQITDKAMLEEGRVYGGGLYKLEPKELANVVAFEIEQLLL